MFIPQVSEEEFREFFDCVEAHFSKELIYFDGRCTSPDMDDYANWIFCLVNNSRTSFLFVPPQVAFFFINLALSNVSPLPNTLTTEDITHDRMRFLHRKYRLQQLARHNGI